MIDKLDASLRFHQEALRLRSHRQELLSANIANSDTPQYKARDFDFSAALSQAVERGGSAGSFLRTSAQGHLGGSRPSAAEADLQYRQPLQSSMDGNTVEMDVERVNFADNALRYEANLSVLSAQIKSMLAAVQS